MNKHKIAFPYYGGKYSKLNFILPNLPTDCKVYCEPFGGSAAVLLNRDPVDIEIYNDINGIIVNFFKVLRDDGERLIELLELTPCSRQECEQAIPADSTDIEKARIFFVRAVMSIFAKGATKNTKPQWRINSLQKFGETWRKKIDGLSVILERLRFVQLECKDAMSVIKNADSKDTLFYLDPPYTSDARVCKSEYKYELTIEQQNELLDLIVSLKGRIAISGYDNDLYNTRLKNWNKIKNKELYLNTSKFGAGGGQRQMSEILWCNYTPPAGIQKQMFG